MKIYSLSRKQVLPISLEQAWKFFSAPENLLKITPNNMGFHILYSSGGDTLYAGKIIIYRIRVLPFYTTTWVTEISHVQEPHYFVDDQRSGPYALWHHQHHFKKVDAGVEMTDEINYAIPFGFIGRLANWLFVGRQVNAIFNYRFRILETHFQGESTMQKEFH
ncbi:MAG TPA: SRPBCC family protein [Ohtaekwangia sp.]